LLQGLVEIVAGGDEVWSQLESALVVGYSFVQPALMKSHQSQVVMSVGTCRLCLNEPLKAFGRLVELALLGENDSKPIIGDRVPGPQLDNLAIAGFAFGKLVLGLADGTQQTPGIGMPGVLLDNLPIKLLGLSVIACLMVVPGKSKNFRDRGHGICRQPGVMYLQ
jgi:hypothetical protein